MQMFLIGNLPPQLFVILLAFSEGRAKKQILNTFTGTLSKKVPGKAKTSNIF
jgi:hypothetical protein